MMSPADWTAWWLMGSDPTPLVVTVFVCVDFYGVRAVSPAQTNYSRQKLDIDYLNIAWEKTELYVF